MDLNKYPLIDLSDTDLDKILAAGKNLLLIGDYGGGKTARVVSCFERNSQNFVYFSGATCDPWIDFIGIPSEDEDGTLKFLRPKRINEDLEAIFVDEFNRADKSVKNALMELIQFKTINGISFPNLKVVWAAINPPADEDESDFSYDVEEMDSAQADRFHHIIRIPNTPSQTFFKKHYGSQGMSAVKWWKDQADNVRRNISSRRLEYAIQASKAGLPVGTILPIDSNIKQFEIDLNTDPAEKAYRILEDSPNEENYKALVREKNLKLVEQTFSSPVLRALTYLAPKDMIAQAYLNNSEYSDFVEFMASIGDVTFKTILEEIHNAYTDNHKVKAFAKVQGVVEAMDLKKRVDVAQAKSVVTTQWIDDSALNSSYAKVEPNTYDRNKLLDFCKGFAGTFAKIRCSNEKVRLVSSFNSAQKNTIQSKLKEIKIMLDILDPQFFEHSSVLEVVRRLQNQGIVFQIPKTSTSEFDKALEKFKLVKKTIK